MEINAALHWPIGEPGIYNKMFKYAASHLRHPTRRILAFFAVENNGASIVRLLPRYHPVCTAVSHFPRDRLLNGERCYTPSSYSVRVRTSHQISKKRRSGRLKRKETIECRYQRPFLAGYIIANFWQVIFQRSMNYRCVYIYIYEVLSHFWLGFCRKNLNIRCWKRGFRIDRLKDTSCL